MFCFRIVASVTGISITNVTIMYMPFKGLIFENKSSDNHNKIRA